MIIPIKTQLRRELHVYEQHHINDWKETDLICTRCCNKYSLFDCTNKSYIDELQYYKSVLNSILNTWFNTYKQNKNDPILEIKVSDSTKFACVNLVSDIKNSLIKISEDDIHYNNPSCKRLCYYKETMMSIINSHGDYVLSYYIKESNGINTSSNNLFIHHTGQITQLMSCNGIDNSADAWNKMINIDHEYITYIGQQAGIIHSISHKHARWNQDIIDNDIKKIIPHKKRLSRMFKLLESVCSTLNMLRPSESIWNQIFRDNTFKLLSNDVVANYVELMSDHTEVIADMFLHRAGLTNSIINGRKKIDRLIKIVPIIVVIIAIIYYCIRNVESN